MLINDRICTLAVRQCDQRVNVGGTEQ